MKYEPYPHQEHAENHIIENPAAGLLLEMGLGKTVVTLSAVDQLINNLFEIDKVLVIAPKRVADTVWAAEAQKWDHLKHLTVSKVLGDLRAREAGLKAKANIYCINRENVPWLISYYGTRFPFDMVVIDESSSFKDSSSQRFKALKMIRPKVNRVVILTGTFRPNTIIDVWSQVYLLDQGKRLGTTLGGFRERYLVSDKRDNIRVHTYKPQTNDNPELGGPDYYEQKIYGLIADICISMKQEDYLKLPPVTYQTREVVLSAKAMQQYEDFERDMVLQLFTADTVITAVNAAVLAGKLLQFANGALYDEEKNTHIVHNEKLEVLAEEVEALNGEPVLIAYWFKSDLERIMKTLKHYKPEKLETEEQINRWNAGKIPVFLLHPASAGHGLNLQHGGHHIIWFGPIWSLELTQQLNARLPRPGQQYPVFIKRLITTGTIEEAVSLSLTNKEAGQNALMAATKAIIKKHSEEL